MWSFIAQIYPKLIKNILLILVIACNPSQNKHQLIRINKKLANTAQISLPNGQTINLLLVITDREQTKGLSGIQQDDFDKDQGMFFFYLEPGLRSFWMPDTYFDLDIFFLDKNLKVIDIERNMPAHPGMKSPPPIAKTRTVFSRHVLEMRSDSPLAKEIKVGTKLKWISSWSLSEIESKIRQQQ